MNLRIGMIGGGYFGQFQMNAWRRIDGARLQSVVVRNAERRAELAQSFPDVDFFDEPSALLETAGQIDVLDVATPPHSHRKLIEPWLGKVATIICQKPFCRDLAEARKLTEAAQRAGTVLVVHENFRFMPWYRTIKNQIDTGALGKIRQAHFRMRPGDGNGEDAYLERQPYFRQMERFLVHETGIHWIDVYRFLFGDPDYVFADVWQTNPVIQGEDSGLLLFGWPDGLRAMFDGNRTLDHQAQNHRLTMGEMTIEGSKATLYLDGYARLMRREFGSNKLASIACDFDDIDFGGDCVFHFQKHVVSHLLDAAPLETLAADYIRNIEIEEAVYRSSASRAAIRLDGQRQ